MDAGLFGGTFNPLHNGHLGVISHIQKKFRLGKVFLFPSATPPHKSSKNLAPAQARFAMVKQSVQGIDGLEASDIELHRRGPSFTIDTITAFQKKLAPGTRCFLIMGSDAFWDIPTWKATHEILQATPLIVMLRGEKADIPAFTRFIEEHVAKGYTFEEKGTLFSHPELNTIHICSVPAIDISSTLIRDRIQRGQSIKELVPAPVERLILKEDLYT